MNAESVGGATPSVRVTWNTTVPPECVASVRVEFRTTHGAPVATYTTTNTSETEVIQTGLQCGTYYYITVVVRVLGSVFTTRSREVRVLVRGKCTIFYQLSYNNFKVVILLYRYTTSSWSES